MRRCGAWGGRIIGRGCPGRKAADGPVRPSRVYFLARPLSHHRLELLTLAGEPISLKCESSVGFLHVCFPGALFRSGWMVPTWFYMLALAAGAWLALCARGLHEQAAAILLPGVIGSALPAVAACWYIGWQQRRTTFSERLGRFRKKLQRKHPTPTPCPRGPQRAVSAGQVWDLYEYFQDLIRDRDMYYMNVNFVKPLTTHHKLSYAELVGPRKITWFVSHYWGMSFRHFVESIRTHAESINKPWRRHTYWVCSLSNNQWNVKEEIGDGHWEHSSFFLALRDADCSGTVMVLDELALPLTRSWCLFEVLQTLLRRAEGGGFQGFFLCTSSGVLNEGTSSVDAVLAVARRLTGLRLEEAEASVPSDKRMIDDLVASRPGGFAEVNRFVRRSIHEALVHARSRFRESFDELGSILDGPPSALTPQRLLSVPR